MWFKFLLIFNFMIFIDFNLYSILSLFYSYFYLYLYLFIFWAWGNGPPFIWKENQQDFEKEEILFLEGQHIYFFHVGIGYKKERKGRRKEKKERKERRQGSRIFLFSKMVSFWKVGLAARIKGEIFFLRKRRTHGRSFGEEEGEAQRSGDWQYALEDGEKFWEKVERCTRAEEGDCSQGSARYASCYFYYYFGIPVYIHLRFSGCFREVILADWSGHWGPLYLRCWIEIFLQACSIMIVFLISLIPFL